MVSARRGSPVTVTRESKVTLTRIFASVTKFWIWGEKLPKTCTSVTLGPSVTVTASVGAARLLYATSALVMACVSVALSVSGSAAAVTVTVCGTFQLPVVPVVNVRVFWLPVLLASVSTVTSVLLLLIVTVTASVGSVSSFTV